MLLSRAPRGALRPFIAQLWIMEASAEAAGDAALERVLPTGCMHVVVRLGGEALRIVQPSGRVDEIGAAVIGGARSASYVKQVARPCRSVGAVLHPGAAWPLLGAPASEFSERHTRLDALWGDAAEALRDRLRGIASAADTLSAFEAELGARVPRLRAIHPLVAHALARFDGVTSVGAVVDESGYSHRRFVTLFREQVGLTPKRYLRVKRFRRALAAAAAGEPLSIVALDAGYSDQAHLTREFHELAGVSPGQYQRLAPVHAHHVPLGDAAARSSDLFKTKRQRHAKVKR